jgi:hypothetical protein
VLREEQSLLRAMHPAADSRSSRPNRVMVTGLRTTAGWRLCAADVLCKWVSSSMLDFK